MTEQKSRFKRFYDFDFFILPPIIKVLTMIGIILCPIVAIIMWAKGEPFRQGLLLLIFGPIVARIYGEILIAIFKITENTQKIVEKK